MKSTPRAAIALTLALLVARSAPAQTLTYPADHTSGAITESFSPTPAATVIRGGESLINRDQGLTTNPPSSVRQPGRRTRLIVAIAFVGGFGALALLLCGHGGCGR